MTTATERTPPTDGDPFLAATPEGWITLHYESDEFRSWETGQIYEFAEWRELPDLRWEPCPNSHCISGMEQYPSGASMTCGMCGGTGKVDAIK